MKMLNVVERKVNLYHSIYVHNQLKVQIFNGDINY